MFKNRSFQVKMVKDDPDVDIYDDEDRFDHRVEIVGEQVKESLVVLGGAVLAYVLADTLRQVAVTLAKKG